MKIKLDDLAGKEIAELLEKHLSEMRAVSPPESKHALDLNELRKPDISFWTVWLENSLAGCGAMKELDAFHAEIKSMHVALEYRNRGVAKMLLEHIIEEAKIRKYRKLSLETGSMAFFEPARQLYLKFGFVYCVPFASYKADPNSVFMTKEL
ncbi:MAG: GNAT family N-acetyltransferase [Oscillatoriaceae cyanobacterium Prado104]|jgi:putative acetyltransferase|nr:GNAT family N-acetyltransferase [Oscillatoriaceae cyanobacterium Prado104]